MYIGNTPTTQSFISGTDYFNGTGSQTAFTLTRTVNSQNDVQAVVNNVVQQPNDGYTISGTTITFTSAPSAGTNNVYVRYLSTTTQSITPSQNSVGWNQLDTNTQQDLGISFKNRIINGAMVIDQRNAGASTTPANAAYMTDRWKFESSPAARFTAQQNAGSVTPPTGFTNYLGFTSNSAYTPLAANYFLAEQLIEGFNIADLGWGTANAKTVTVSFWVRSSLTGTFSGNIQNGGNNRFYVFSYTISTANTWEYKTVTIAGDTTGTWATNNTTGLLLRFSLGAGTDFLSSAGGSWGATPYFGVTGQTNVVATNGATFYLTGVQLEVGTQATTFTTAGGSYGAELALCQRYYYRISPAASTRLLGQGQCFSTIAAGAAVFFPVSMRTRPSALEQTGTATDYAALTAGGGTQVCNGVPTFNPATTADAAYFVAAFASGVVAGDATSILTNSTSSYLGWSAEL